MLNIAYFEIQADEPDVAIRFYEGLFGWHFSRADGLPIPYWRIETDGIRGGLLKRPARRPPPECGTNAFICSVEVTDFDRTASAITKAGGQLALPMRTSRMSAIAPTISPRKPMTVDEAPLPNANSASATRMMMHPRMVATVPRRTDS